MHVSKLMRANPATTSPDTSFEDLLRTLARRPARQLFVTDSGGRLLGMVTSYDLLKAMSPFFLDSNLAKALPDDVSFLRHAFQANAHKKASDIMTRTMKTLSPSDHFLEAETLVRECVVNVLPVVDEGGRLVGEVTRKVIIDYLASILLGEGPAAGTPGQEGKE